MSFSFLAIDLRAEDADRLVAEGVKLHDKFKYAEAIESYLMAIEMEPDHCLAHYELSLTYATIGEHENAVKYAEEGIEKCTGQTRAKCYANAGSELDLLGQPTKAIEYFRKAIDISSDVLLVSFNLAVTFARQRQLDSAGKYFRAEILINPKHASSHRAMSLLYLQENRTVASVLSTCRFLTLESTSERSAVLSKTLIKSFGSGTKKNASGGLDMFASMDSSAIDGNLSMLDMSFKLGRAAATIDTTNKSEFESWCKQLDLLFAALSVKDDAEDERPGFIFKAYSRYFSRLRKEGHTEAMLAVALATAENKDVADWAAANPHKIAAFAAWNLKQ